MKTVKLLQKVNIVFLLMILLMALATFANHVFGQTPQWEKSQTYGDSSLVDFDAIFYQDSAAIELPYDEDIKEVIIICYPDTAELAKDKKVWIVKDAHDIAGVTFYGVTYTFIKTVRGVTCLLYYYNDAYKEGLLFLNGKIVTRYVFGDSLLKRKRITPDLDGIPSDLFKDDTFWRYKTERP